MARYENPAPVIRCIGFRSKNEKDYCFQGPLGTNAIFMKRSLIDRIHDRSWREVGRGGHRDRPVGKPYPMAKVVTRYSQLFQSNNPEISGDCLMAQENRVSRATVQYSGNRSWLWRTCGNECARLRSGDDAC
jgi:hypothetical protein